MAGLLAWVSRPNSFLSKSGYRFIRELGAGSFGVVGLFERDNIRNAIKILDLDRLIEQRLEKYEQQYGVYQDERAVADEVIADIDKELHNVREIAKRGPAVCGDYFDFILTYEVAIDNKNNYYYLISEPMTSDLLDFFKKCSATGLSDSGKIHTDSSTDRSGRTSGSCPQAVIEGVSNNRDELLLAVICQLFYAIYCLHQIGVVHGDLKPANIFINGETGQIKVADFGGSAWLGQDPKSAYLSQITSATPLYIAPERAVDPRITSRKSDAWSLGVIVLELTAKDRKIIRRDLKTLSQTELFDLIETNVVLDDKELEKWVKALLSRLLVRNDKVRSSLHDIVFDEQFSARCHLPVDTILKKSNRGTRLRKVGRTRVATIGTLNPSRDVEQIVDEFTPVESKTSSQIMREFE